MGSDVSHFNISLIVQDKVTMARDKCPYITFLEEKGEPKRGIEPASFHLPAERLTIGPIVSRLTIVIVVIVTRTITYAR